MITIAMKVSPIIKYPTYFIGHIEIIIWGIGTIVVSIRQIYMLMHSEIKGLTQLVDTDAIEEI